MAPVTRPVSGRIESIFNKWICTEVTSKPTGAMRNAVFWVSCQRPDSWHVNLEFEMTEPSRDREQDGGVSTGECSAGESPRCLVWREIKINVKDTAHALEGFPCFPEGQQQKLVSSHLLYKAGSVTMVTYGFEEPAV